MNIEIDNIQFLDRYYIRKKDGVRVPNLPYPLSKEDIKKRLSEYNKMAEDLLLEIVEVTGKIEKRKFKVRIWHLKYMENIVYYNYVAYVMKGAFHGKKIRTKDIKYVPSNPEELRIYPMGITPRHPSRHKFTSKEIDEIMKYIGSFSYLSPEGDIIMKDNTQGLTNKDFIKNLILIWYVFYGRVDL